jgi:hypothetical protein
MTRDLRFTYLDRLISLGLGNLRLGKSWQVVECVTCHCQIHRHIDDIKLDEPQFCSPRCAGTLPPGILKREQNLILGGRPRRPGYESPEVRREIYLKEKAEARA